MLLLFAIAYSLVGGWLSRMCGGGPPRLPYGIDTYIFCIPFALVGLLISPWAGIASYAFAVLGKRIGHGRGISLKEPMKPTSEPERVEVVSLWLIDKIPTYWYKCLVLLLTAFVQNIGLSVCLVFVNLVFAVLFFLSSIFKPIAYMIGWRIYPKGHGPGIPRLSSATALGEFLTGFFTFLCLLILIYTI